MKLCSVCKVEKPISEFYKHSTGKYGVAGSCKVCRKTYLMDWYVKNKQRYSQITAKWSKENLHKKRSYRAKRRAAILNATPHWADINAIQLIYKQADSLNKTSNNKYEVDHIVPLQGKTVSGMHVPWNLQVIPAKENLSKGNR